MNQNAQDKKRRELREQFEDAYVRMLVYEVAKMEGEELLEKNERLKNDPSFQVPERITQKCLETIREEIKKKEKKKRWASLRRVAKQVACVAAILGAMGVTAYAAFPSFRAATLNLLIQTSNVSTRLTMTDEKPEDTVEEQDEQGANEQKVLLGYVIPETPEGLTITDEWKSDNWAWIEYANNHGSRIKFSVYHDTENAINLDTEDAAVESIEIQNAEGLMCTKDGATTVVWNDTQTGSFLEVSGIGVEEETVLQLAEKLVMWAEN